MKKNGFTLIELLAVIIVLGVISLIVFPTVNSTLNKQKDKLYNRQVETIEQAAQNWCTNNTNKLPTGDEKIYISLDTLVNQGFLKNKDIKDPRDNKDMTKKSCVEIVYDEEYKQYTYTYIYVGNETILGKCSDAE